MKREIKFRGKRIANNEWAYGSLLVWADGECTILEKSDSSNAMWKREINPDTVGQFTGLCDKNGIEIYESDIVKTKEYGIDIANGVYCSNVVGYDTFIITWNNGGFILENNKRCFRLCKDSHLEVIGNIYDNPELLKGGRK